MFHILIGIVLGIVLILIGLGWMTFAWFGSLWETGDEATKTLRLALWGLIPIVLGILVIWRW